MSSTITKDLGFDKRLLARQVAKGQISLADRRKMQDDLPDVKAKAEWILADEDDDPALPEVDEDLETESSEQEA